MKKSINVFLSFLIVSCILIANTFYVFAYLPSDIIPISEFDDTKFYNFVLSKADINLDEALQYSEAESLTLLFAVAQGINSIKGIKYFTGLTNLNMQNNNISNIDELCYLQKIKTLNLGNNQITSLNAITNITSLETINFSSNQNISIGDLSSLVNLRSIYLSDTKITSLDAIKNFSYLTNIDFSSNQITSIEELSFLVNLKSIKLSNNKITSLYGFPSVSGATIDLSSNWIDFESPLNTPIYNQIKANNPIDKLIINNQDLVLPTDNDPILNNLDGIFDTNLYNNARIQADINKDNILTKGEARHLQYLIAQQCNIASMKGIEFFTGLTILDLAYNRISTIHELDGRHNMWKIDLSNNRIDFGILTNYLVKAALIEKDNILYFENQDPDLPSDNDVIRNDETGIPDTVFYNLVLRATNAGEILTKGNARRLTLLIGQNLGIIRVKGLEYLLGLKTLDLSINKISNLDSFKNLIGCNIILDKNNIDMSNINNINIKNMLLASNNSVSLTSQVILKYYIDPRNNYIYGVDINKTIEQFNTEIMGEGLGSVDYSKTNIPVGSTLATGSKITISVNGNYLELTAIIHGDLNGDGNISLNDLVLIRDYLLETIQLTDLSKASGDIYGEGSITLNDLIWSMDYITRI